MRIIKQVFAISSLLALAACAGGGGNGGGTPLPSSATRLVYANPTDDSAYRWLADSSLSTNTHLVLYLAAPAGVNLHGVGFHLTVDATKAAWIKVSSADPTYLQNAAFNLGSGPQALSAKVSGATLQGGVFQKAARSTPVASTGQPLIRIALDLAAGATPGTVSIQQIPAKALALIAGTTAAPGNITTVVGGLQAQ